MSRLSRFIHFYTDEYDGVPVPSPVEKTVKGSIVSISDALAAPLRSLLVNIDPVQDLHGYDNPWPAGGGSNILAPQTFSSSGSGVDITSTADGGIKINGTASAYKQSDRLQYRCLVHSASSLLWFLQE